MVNQGTTKRSEVARKLALILTIAAVLLSLFIALFGIPGSRIAEGGGAVTVWFRVNPQGFFAAAGSILVTLGLAMRKMTVAWFGTGILSACAAIFFFGIGLFYIPVVVSLLVLLTIAQGKQP